jgi:hypothetical protein
MFFPPQPPSGLSAHELHTRRLMVRSVSWLTLRSLFATAATSPRQRADAPRVRRDGGSVPGRARLGSCQARRRSKTSLGACGAIDSALDTGRDASSAGVARASIPAEILAYARAAYPQRRRVSKARIRLDSRKSVQSFKDIICVDISEFESSDPSHAVGLPKAVSPPVVGNSTLSTRVR